LAARVILERSGWHIVGGQPPRGSDDLALVEIRSPNARAKGSSGSFKPDLIAYREPYWCLFEAKPRYSPSDRRKLIDILSDPRRIEQLAIELTYRRLIPINAPEPRPQNIFGCLVHAGSSPNCAPIFCLNVAGDLDFVIREPFRNKPSEF
jgi:hypothetical protein